MVEEKGQSDIASKWIVLVTVWQWCVSMNKVRIEKRYELNDSRCEILAIQLVMLGPDPHMDRQNRIIFIL